MKTRILLTSLLFLSASAFAGSQADYQAGIDFTNDPTGGQPASNGKPAGQNASNIQSLIQLYVKGHSLDQTTGSSTNQNLNNGSQSAQDVNVLRQYFQQSNSANATAAMSLSGPGGRGDQKIQYCKDYIDKNKTPNPDPTKYAECQAVVELNGQRIRDYRASTGFSHSDSIFSSSTQIGMARQAIVDTPQNQLLSMVGVGGPSGPSGQQCVTVNKISPPQTTTAQCERAAIPDSVSCNNTITPKVILEKYCNASGGPYQVKSFISSSGSGNSSGSGISNMLSPNPTSSLTTFNHVEPFFATNNSGPVQIEYTCGTPSAIDGSITTIIARIHVPAGTYPDNNGGHRGPVSMEFAPGVSHPWVSGSLGYYWWQSCVGWGMGCNGNIIDYNYAMFYDGPTDNVYVRYLGASRDGSAETGGDTMASCAPGSTFIPGGVPFSLTTCVPGDWTNNFTPTCSSSNYWAQPSRCETTGITSSFSYMPTITTAVPSVPVTGTDLNGNTYTYMTCATGVQGVGFGGVGASNTCYIPHYPGCPMAPPGDSWIMATPPVTSYTPVVWNGAAYTGGVPIFPPQYCTLQSSIDNLHLFVPAPHYLGGAGVRERLVESVVDTCAALQAQSATGPTASGGSYAPVSQTKDTCPVDWTLPVASASFPAICQYQPPDVPATATVTFICPTGGTYNSATKLCEYQKPPYSAVASKLYTCPTGDALQGNTCPNNGAKSGDSCLYKAYPAGVASQSCPTGFFLSGSLCYNDLALAQTITVANGTSVLNSTKTYSCPGTDVLNGTMCEPSAQVVMCEHQPPSVPSKALDHYSCPISNRTGNYFISYSMADNTIWSQACVAFMITKQASLQSRVCDAPYGYNSTSGKCEYQLPDYASSIAYSCADNTYTYSALTGLCEKAAPVYNAF